VWSRQLRAVPPAAQGLDQRYRIGHLLHLKTIQCLLVCQHSGLGNQYVEVGIDASIVPRLFELEEGSG